MERGENSGRVLTYTHIVTARQAIGMWDPRRAPVFAMPLEEVLGAHRTALPSSSRKSTGSLPGAILAASAFGR